MLIGYDGRFITSRPTGNGIYARRLIEAVTRLDQANRYRIYLLENADSFGEHLGSGSEIKMLPGWCRSSWLRVPLGFPLELCRRRVDLFHAHYTIPPFIRARLVLTLHDFFYLIYPEYFVSLKRLPVTHTIGRSIRRADRILVGTSFIRQQTIERFGIPEDRVRVIPYGVDARYFDRGTPQAIREMRAKYRLDNPYILAVGDIHPRKNLARLIDAFIDIRKNYDLKLVLVGKPLWKTTEIFTRIARAGLEDHVIATGYVPDEDLPLLYQEAAIFCYPSLYEGFGFPILEAMASGVPVAISETTSCPAVGGSHAFYFDPESVASISNTIQRALNAPGVCQDHVAKGLAWARSFTWDRTARQTIEIYHELT